MNFDEFCEKLLGKKKEFRLPTEEEYYAHYARLDPERFAFGEPERDAVQRLKECPIPYELMKKIVTGEL